MTDVTNQNWIFYRFHRGDLVSYEGFDKMKPLKETYVWSVVDHIGIIRVLIQHPDGSVTKETLKHNDGFCDGFENVHSSEVQKGLHYHFTSPDRLTLIKRSNGNSFTSSQE